MSTRQLPTQVPSRPGRRLALAAVFVVLALPLGGCQVTEVLRGERTWRQTVEVAGGGTQDVVVVDRSGRVRGVGFDAQPAANPVDPARPATLVVPWTGGACDRTTTLTVTPTGMGLAIAIAVVTAPGGCDAIGLGRAVALELDGPVDPKAVVIEGPAFAP